MTLFDTGIEKKLEKNGENYIIMNSKYDFSPIIIRQIKLRAWAEHAAYMRIEEWRQSVTI